MYHRRFVVQGDPALLAQLSVNAADAALLSA